MSNFIPTYLVPNPVIITGFGARVRGYIFKDDMSREALSPAGGMTLYTAAETGAAGNTTMHGSINRISMVTDSTGAGDDQSLRTSGLRFDRNYPSLVSGMANLLGEGTSTMQIDLPFQLSQTAATEFFVGIHANSAALTALPTTVRHMGIYADISVGANFICTSADGTTQTTTDTTIAADTNAHIIRIIWTAEDAGTIQLFTAAGVTEGTGQTVAALNGTSGNEFEAHWFVQTEGAAAKTMSVYPWRVLWT